MASNKQVTYDINFNTNMTSLEQLKETLSNLETMTRRFKINVDGVEVTKAELNKIQAIAEQVGSAIEDSFNPKLNTINFVQFQNILKSTGLDIKVIESEFSKLGVTGKNAFRDLAEQIYTSNAALKQTKGFLANIGETLFNAAKWSVAYGAINNITNGIKSAWTYAVSLDSALNDIRIVTGKSYEEMEKFAKSANKAAKTLGTSTMDYTKGSLIYYQQGLGQKDVEARTAVSAKTANVTGQSMQEVSEELTAVWNGFQVTAQDAEGYVDRLAAVAAASASDLEELSTAMSRVASSASTMGINIDQLTAQIATIESVTRQDAASIGTALKTIYSRMGDLAIGTKDEFGVTLGDVSGKMKQMGIDILDQSGNMRSMGTIIEEVAAKWNTWTSAQQQAAAVALAGKRQYNNLFALFENWDMYEANKTVSENSIGELQKQQDTYMESTRAHLEQLSTSAEKVKNAFFDNKQVNGFIDILSKVVDLFGTFVENIGGGATLLIGTFGILGKSMSSVVGKNVGGFAYDHNPFKKNDNDLQKEAQNNILQQFGNSSDAAVQEMSKIEAQRLKYADYLTEEENDRYNLLIRQTNELMKQKEQLEEIKEKTQAVLQQDSKAYNGLFSGVDLIKKNGEIVDINSSEFSLKDLGELNDETKTELQKRIDERRQKNQDNLSKLKSFEKIDAELVNVLDDTGKLRMDPGKGASKKEQQLYQRQQTYKGLYDKTIQSGGDLDTMTQDVLGRGLLSKDTKKELRAAQRKFKKTKAASKDGSGDIEVRKQSVELTNALKKAYTDEAKALNQVNDGLQKNAAKTANVNGQLKDAKEIVADLGDKGNWQKITDNITQFVSVLMQVYAAFQALSSVANTWEDDTKSAGEKVGATFSAIVPILLMILPYYGKINAMILTRMALRKKATSTEIASTAEETAAVVAGEGAKSAAITATGAAGTAAGTAVQIAWWPLLLITIAIAATLAAIIAVMYAFKKASETSLDKAKKAYEEENNALQEMQQNLQNVKSAYEDLLDTIDKYKDSRDGIDDLKAGTEEWEQAIVAANEQALSLIDTYAELAKYASTDESGFITISNEGLELVKDKQQNQLQKAQANLYAQNARTKEANNKLAQENFIDSISPDRVGWGGGFARVGIGAGSGFAAGTGIGAAIGTATMPIIGTAVGAIVGSIIGLAGGVASGIGEAVIEDTINKNKIERNNDIYSQMIEKYTDDASYFSSNDFNQSFKEMTEGLDKTDEELVKLKQSLMDSIEAQVANTKASDLLRQQYAKNILESENNADYKNAKNKDAVTTIFANEMDKVSDKYSNDTRDKDLAKDEVFKENLANSLGINKEKIIDIKDGQISYIDSNGETKTIDKATAVNQANEYNAKKVAEDNLKEIVKVTNKINDSEYSAFNELAGGKKKASLKGLAYGQLIDSTFGAGASSLLTEDEAKILGYDSLEDYQKAVKASIELSQKEANNSLKNIKKLGGDDLRNKNDYSIDTIKQIEAATEKAYSAAGESGAKALTNLLNNVNAEQAQTIAEIAGQLDWTDLNAVENFNTKLKEAGIDIDENNEAYQNFISSLSSANNVLAQSIKDLDTLTDKLKEINDLTEDLKIGSVISQDDYKKIISIYSGAKEFFVRTADGYKMIAGSAKQIQEGMKNRYANLKDAQNYYQTLNDIGKTTFKDQQFNAKATGADLTSQGNFIKSLNKEQKQALLTFAGISNDAFNASISAGNNRSTQQEKDLQTVIQAAQEVIAIAQGNGFDSSAASQLYFTKNGFGNFKTWGDVEKSSEFKNIKDREKIRQAWLSEYADELEASIDVINSLSKGYKDIVDVNGKVKLTADEQLLNDLEFLNSYDKRIEAISDLGKNLTGDELAKNYEQQNEILNKARELQQKIVDTQKENLGATGKTYLGLLKEYSSIYSSLSDEQKEDWNTLLEDSKKLEDTTNNMANNIISAIDASLDGVKDEVDRNKSLNEFREKYYKNGQIKNSFEMQDEISISQRRDINSYNSQENLKYIEKIRESITELDSRTDISEDLRNSKRKEYEKQLQDALQTEIDNINELYQVWSDGWDKITDKCEKYVSKLETLNDIYDKQISLMKIQDKNFFNAEILTKQANNMQKIIVATQLEYTKALKHFTEATTETEKNAAKEDLDSAAAVYLSAVENYYEKLKSNFSEIVNNIYTQAGISDANERWERTSAYNDQYLNAADAQLNINKLQRNYKSAIDNASSLNAQTQLRVKMEEELNKLQANRNKLTQYEVDRANAVYELTLKQIALEESQRNASKMKLTRDSNGNLTYAFVQDQDVSAKAQEEFEQAQNNLFNIDNDETKAQIDKYYQYQSQAQSALAEAAAAGDKERFKELEEYYYGDNGLITNLQNSLFKAQINLTESFKNIFPEDDINALSAYAQAVNIGAESLEKFKDGLNKAYDDFEIAFNTFVKNEGDLQTALSKTSELLNTLIQDIDSDTYKQDVETIAKELEKLVELLKNPSTELNFDRKESVPQEDQIKKMLETVNGTKGFLEDINRKLNKETLSTTGTLISESFAPKISDIYKGFYEPSLSNYFNAVTNKKEEPDLIQNITINPNFPNATSIKDINEAINGLGDQLFQHAGITKR